MAKRNVSYTCKITYTEGYEKRLTQALVDIYYNHLHGIGSTPKSSSNENTSNEYRLKKNSFIQNKKDEINTINL